MRNFKFQQLVIPKGLLSEEEAAVIEIPKRFQKAPVVILKRRLGERAESRVAEYFVDAPSGAHSSVFNRRNSRNSQAVKRSQVPRQGNECSAPQQVLQQAPCPAYVTTGPDQMISHPQGVVCQSAPAIQQVALCPSSPTYVAPSIPASTPIQVYPQAEVCPSFTSSRSVQAHTQQTGAPCPSAPSRPIVVTTTSIQPSSSQASTPSRPCPGYPQPGTACPSAHRPILTIPQPSTQNVCPAFQQPSMQKLYTCPVYYSSAAAGNECPAMVALARQELNEKDLFNRSLDEFQKARRKYLTQANVIKTEDSDSDSSDD